MQQLGSSILTLSGANTYSGGTTISAGRLQVTNNSLVGSGTVTLNGGTFLADGLSNLTFGNNFTLNAPAFGSAIDTNGVTLTLSGVVGGTGALTVLDTFGGGILILTNTNAYSGGTTICNCSTLQLGTLATQGSIVGAVTNEGVFDIVNANTAGITSILNESAFGFATTTFFNSNSASSIAITNDSNGATVFGVAAGTDTATAGNAVITNSNGGSTAFLAMTTAGNASITNHFGSGTFFGDLSTAGHASIVNQFGGQTIFGTAFGTDAPSAGTAIISNELGGITQFNAFATASSASITNHDGGGTDFFDSSTAGNATITTINGGATFFFDNADGGTAQFITAGTGFVDFAGSLGPNGDGRINAGSIAGSGFYYIGVGNTLVVGGNHLSTEVSGVIADDCGCLPGPGSLEKVGTGALTLSGFNTYTGATFVNEGSLLVTGSIASSLGVVVDNGATLGGNGTVPLTSLLNGAVLAPGLPTALGTLTVNDVLSFCNCTFYDVKVTSGGNDFTLVVPNSSGICRSRRHGAGEVSRQHLPLQLALYDPDRAGRLRSRRGSHAVQFAGRAHRHQRNAELHRHRCEPDAGVRARTGLGIERQPAQRGQRARRCLQRAWQFRQTWRRLQRQRSDQPQPAFRRDRQRIAAGDLRCHEPVPVADVGPVRSGRSGGPNGNVGAIPFAEESALGYAAKKPRASGDAFAKFPTKADVARIDLFDRRWSTWGAAYGGSSHLGQCRAGIQRCHRARVRVCGGGRLSPLAQYAGRFRACRRRHDFSVSGFGSGRSDLFQAGAFIRHNIGNAYVTAAAAYGWQDVTTERTVTAAGFERLRAQFNANAYSGRIEGGYRYLTPWMGITPYAAGQFTTYSLPAYAEQVLAGAGTFALNYAARTSRPRAANSACAPTSRLRCRTAS